MSLLDELAKAFGQLNTDGKTFFYLFSLSSYEVPDLIKIKNAIDEVIHEKAKDF